MGRTMRQLREAKRLSYETLVVRMDTILKKRIEDVLRELGRDMRGAWPIRDRLLERVRVRAETLERWEKVGFGVQRGTRATRSFYKSPAFLALVEVLDAVPEDLQEESANVTLQPGDTVIRPVDEEGYATFGEGATDVVRFLALPDGFGGTVLKEEQLVTNADREAIKTYLEEEEAFLEAGSKKDIDILVQHELVDFDDALQRMLDEEV